MQVYNLLGEEWRRKADEALVGFLKGSACHAEKASLPAYDFSQKWLVNEVMAESTKSLVSVMDGDEREAFGYASGSGQSF